MNRCCPNALKESRSERVGLYRNEQGGFAFLALLKIVYLFIGVIELIVGTRLLKGNNTGKHRRNTINAMHNMMHAMTWQYKCVLG